MGNDWLAVGDDGRFCGTQGGQTRLHYVQDRRVVPLSALFDSYYTPGLLRALVTGEEGALPPTKDIRLGIAPPPRVRIAEPQHGTETTSESVVLRYGVVDEGGGVAESQVYLNDKLVDEKTRGIKVKRAADERTVELTLSPGDNVIRVVARSSAGVDGPAATVTVTRKGASPTSRLFLVAVGINKYKNARYTLSYARPDAEAFVRVVEKSVKKLVTKVEVVTIHDARATREQLLSVLDGIAATARPEDVFLFYYAGHGAMSEPETGAPSEFFLAPHDVIKLYGDNTHLRARGLSAAELRAATTKIPAQKQLIVLDACQSGGAVDSFAMRGAAEEKAILQLARSAGVALLAATGSEQYAAEAKSLGHGLFTDAVVEALGGAADGSPRDGRVTVKELEAYLNERLPALTEKHKSGAQYPHSFTRGQDFPLTLTTQR
ncbi:MAG: caspase family protein [Planctomycetes bacterium]|nr:caspase family protein [Planctomycetota bacterium]